MVIHFSIKVVQYLIHSFHQDAKKKACESGIIPLLLTQMRTNELETIVAFSGALMSITVDVEAKKSMVRDGGLDVLKSLLDSSDERVLLNVIQTITNCSEDYRARFSFQQLLPRVCF